MKNDDLGNRMKSYESQGTSINLWADLPIIIRLDGKAFHSFTKGLDRPFDERLTHCMIELAKKLVKETSAKIGYTQSDEITLIIYHPDYKSRPYFDGKLHKINSVLAAKATLWFNNLVYNYLPYGYSFKEPCFDCRAFNTPSIDEAINCLRWREMDAIRNSVAMLAQSKFSHKELQGKGRKQMLEMLGEINIDWHLFPERFKRGTYIMRQTKLIPFTKEEIENLPEKHEAKKNPRYKIKRKVIDIQNNFSIMREESIEKAKGVLNV